MQTQNKEIPFILVLLLLFLFPFGCDDQGGSESGSLSNPVSLLRVEQVFPTNVYPLGSVRLEGVGFGIEGKNDGVWLSGMRMPIRYWTATQIDFVLPKEMAQGAYFGVVRANDRVSEPFELNVLLSYEFPIEDQNLDRSVIDSQDMSIQDMSIQDMNQQEVGVQDIQVSDAQILDM